MCDTLVATADATASGVMMMAKNSDREPNEAQNITFVPARDYPANSRVPCTYIEIPQVRHTFASLLSRPFWMFGAEMGVNEHGVAIGNEAVFTREKYIKKNSALLGMDMLRLALERTRTAREARDCIIALLEEFGQGGNCAMEGKLYYHNSFIIADADDAIILETAGKHWVSKKAAGVASISNCLTIEDDFDDSSPGLEEYARSRGYIKKNGRLKFSRDFSDPLFTHFARGRIRRSCSQEFLSKKMGNIVSNDMINILRDHNVTDRYRPGDRPMERICLHYGGLISSQSVGSMVALLKKGSPPLVYLTGTSAPCVSLFKPHTIVKNMDVYGGSPAVSPSPWGGTDIYGSSTAKYDASTEWWKGEDIHRRVLMSFDHLHPRLASLRDPLERDMIDKIEKKWVAADEKTFQKICFQSMEELLPHQNVMVQEIKKIHTSNNSKQNIPWWFLMQWRRKNHQAGMKISY